MDFYLEWGGDFVLTPNGSIQTAINWDQVRQRIIRRFLTNSAQQLPDGSYTAPDYVFDIKYGIGAGALVDQNPTQDWLRDLTGRLRQSVLADSAVDQGSVPRMQVTGLGTDAYQVFASVKLINGQSGQVSITVSHTGST